MLKTCKYCGKEFVPSAYYRSYCSAECAELGKKQLRQEWMKKTDYRKHDAERHRQRRSQERELRSNAKKEKDEALIAEQENRLQKYKDSFNARCEAGDPICLMLKAKSEHGIMSVEYWDAFRKYMLSLDSSGTTIVNGISVFDDDFSDHVIESIHQIKAVHIREVGVK